MYFQLSSKDIHLQFRELSLKYGPVFTIFMPVPVVIITSYEGVKEAYVTKGMRSGEERIGRIIDINLQVKAWQLDLPYP